MDDNDWLSAQSTGMIGDVNTDSACSVSNILDWVQCYHLGIVDPYTTEQLTMLTALAKAIVGGAISHVVIYSVFQISTSATPSSDVAEQAISVPIMINQTTIGHIVVSDEPPKSFTSANHVHLEAIAVQIQQVIKQSQLKSRMNAQYMTPSWLDPVTQLSNKQYFLHSLAQHDYVQNIHGLYGQIGVIKVEGLTHINRIYSSVLSDHIMIDFSQRIMTSLPDESMLARLSEDMFVVFISSNYALSDVDYFFHITQVLEKPVTYQNKPIFVTSKVSCVPIVSQKMDPNTLIKQCITHLHEQVGQGDPTSAMDAEHERLIQRASAIESQLRNGIKQNIFSMVYQPIVESYTQTMVGVEALIRWRWQPNEFLSPAEFIPIAAETGLIMPLSQWIINTACVEFAALQDEHSVPLYLSLNISSTELLTSDFMPMLLLACEHSQLAYNQIQLEISEQVLMQEYDDVIQRLSELSAAGIRIAIDDFGTGNSSLQYLHTLPVDVVKIDQTLIATINHSDQANTLVRAIISLSHELGKLITAKGIETFAQAEFLRAENISTGQGWYYAKPVSFKALLLQTSQLSFS